MNHRRPCGGDCSAQQQVPRQCEHKSSQVGRENQKKGFRQIQNNGGKGNGSVGAVGDDVVDKFLLSIVTFYLLYEELLGRRGG